MLHSLYTSARVEDRTVAFFSILHSGPSLHLLYSRRIFFILHITCISFIVIFILALAPRCCSPYLFPSSPPFFFRGFVFLALSLPCLCSLFHARFFSFAGTPYEGFLVLSSSSFLLHYSPLNLDICTPLATPFVLALCTRHSYRPLLSHLGFGLPGVPCLRLG